MVFLAPTLVGLLVVIDAKVARPWHERAAALGVMNLVENITVDDCRLKAERRYALTNLMEGLLCHPAIHPAKTVALYVSRTQDERRNGDLFIFNLIWHEQATRDPHSASTSPSVVFEDQGNLAVRLEHSPCSRNIDASYQDVSSLSKEKCATGSLRTFLSGPGAGRGRAGRNASSFQSNPGNPGLLLYRIQGSERDDSSDGANGHERLVGPICSERLALIRFGIGSVLYLLGCALYYRALRLTYRLFRWLSYGLGVAGIFLGLALLCSLMG